MSEYRFVVGFRRTHRYYGITLRGQKFFNSDVVFDIFAGYVHKRDSFHLGGCHFRVLNDNELILPVVIIFVQNFSSFSRQKTANQRLLLKHHDGNAITIDISIYYF
jgi:hypothetical protein